MERAIKNPIKLMNLCENEYIHSVPRHAISTLADNNNNYGKPFYYFFATPYPNGSCPAGSYSSYRIYNTDSLQISQIVSYGGILFTAGIFGVRSALGWRLTFFLDDYVILLLGLTPVIPFYVIIQVSSRLNVATNVFVYITIIAWIFICWILLSAIHDFNFHYDLSENTKRIMKMLLGFVHLIFSSAILATNIFIICYDYYNSPDSQKDIGDISNQDAFSFLIHAIYFIMSVILIIYFFKQPINKYPLRIFFITLFISVINVFFAYAYICSLPIIDSIFNFFVGMVLSRAVVALFSDKKIIYDYIMEVDDESNLMIIDKDLGEVDRDCHELKRKHLRIQRFFAFLFFLNYANGKFMWKKSLVGYVDKEQKFFTSKTNSLIIRCESMKYIKGEEIKHLSDLNDSNDSNHLNHLNRFDLKIEDDKMILEKLEKTKDEDNIKIGSVEKAKNKDNIKIGKDEIDSIKLETLKLEIKDKESVNIDLFGRGKIIKLKKDQENDIIIRYWSATLDIEDNRMYLVQRLEFQDIGVAFSGRGFKKNVQLFPNFDNKNSDDGSMKITYDGDFKKYQNDENNENYNWELDIDHSKLIFDKIYAPNSKKSDIWNLKIKNNKAFITNKRLIDECEALNNNGKKAINLDRDVSLKGKWKIANQKIIHEKKSHDKYKIKKTILNDSPNNDKNLWEDKNLLVDGNSRLRIEKNGIYMEYKLIKENIKKAEAKINIDDKNEEIEINDQISNDNALKVVDYPFWDATWKRYESDIFLKHKVNQKNVINMSIEGKKFINLDIENFKNEDDLKQNNIKINDNIIKLTYSKIQYRKILYREDLTETFQSLTINDEVKITKEGDAIIIREMNNNRFRGMCNRIFSKSEGKNVDDKTDENINKKTINKLEIKKNYWFREEKEHHLHIRVEDVKKKLAKIYIHANSTIVRNHREDKTNKNDKIKNHHEEEIIKMENGGKLKIERTDNGLMVVLLKNISLNTRGTLKIQQGCVTHIETPEGKRFIDLTKHGFLNYVMYHHKKHKKMRQEMREVIEQRIEESKKKPIEGEENKQEIPEITEQETNQQEKMMF
ncbi:4140_t:CDS:2 [Scutellospora calospora]|uniref:4140_t:CDS:1 n=1 Tax=Scutellospora calospora TaxID=85575 RepID=A0ACA9K1U3_9GLOM|nr:4140_t:CDS:2 [Scutellospora calospora]